MIRVQIPGTPLIFEVFVVLDREIGGSNPPNPIPISAIDDYKEEMHNKLISKAKL